MVNCPSEFEKSPLSITDDRSETRFKIMLPVSLRIQYVQKKVYIIDNDMVAVKT